MSIQQIIREAIGEDKPTGFIGENSHLDTTFFKQEIGYQQALADLRNKIPEIERKIVEEIEKIPPATRYETEEEKVICSEDIIKNLTS